MDVNHSAPIDEEEDDSESDSEYVLDEGIELVEYSYAYVTDEDTDSSDEDNFEVNSHGILNIDNEFKTDEMQEDSEQTSSDDELSNVGFVTVIEKSSRDVGFVSVIEKSSRDFIFKPFFMESCVYNKQNNLYPKERSGHRIVATASHLYILGGFHPLDPTIIPNAERLCVFNELWSYNYAANVWKLHDNFWTKVPKEVVSNDLVMYKNVLISHGGTSYPFGKYRSNECYAFSIGKEPIVKCIAVTGELPHRLYGPSIGIKKDYLYTVGGTTGLDFFCDVYRLNLKTKVWEKLYELNGRSVEPGGRYRHGTVYDDRYIYVLGGSTTHYDYSFATIYAFDLDFYKWVKMETFPDPNLLTTSVEGNDLGFPKARRFFSCTQHTLSNGDIEAIIIGGSHKETSILFSDVWKLNMRTKQWSLMSTAVLPKPLYFHAAAYADNGCMYIFGGITMKMHGLERQNNIYKMWVKIPKLSEICWEAILHFNKKLAYYGLSNLKAMGIPKAFLDRLPEQIEK